MEIRYRIGKSRRRFFARKMRYPSQDYCKGKEKRINGETAK